jgi:pimeloyl-ACP methyl ester carboxylesterase
MGGVNPSTKAAEEGDLEKATEIFGKAILGEKAYHDLSDERREQVMQNAFLAEFTGSGFLSVNPFDLRKVAIPTLLVNGDESPAIFHRIADRIHELLPTSTRIEISQASHIVHEDNATEFNQAMMGFLDQI